MGRKRKGKKEVYISFSLSRALKTYGLITRYYFFGGSERVIVGDPAAMKHILVTNSRNYIKPPDRIL